MSATISTETLLTLAAHASTTPTLRLLFWAAERANRSGLALFEPQELGDLMGDAVTGERAQSRTLHDVIGMAIRVGLIEQGSNTTAIQIDTSKVQPEGYAEVGSRYGRLTLVRDWRGHVGV